MVSLNKLNALLIYLTTELLIIENIPTGQIYLKWYNEFNFLQFTTLSNFEIEFSFTPCLSISFTEPFTTTIKTAPKILLKKQRLQHLFQFNNTDRFSLCVSTEETFYVPIFTHVHCKRSAYVPWWHPNIFLCLCRSFPTSLFIGNT